MISPTSRYLRNQGWLFAALGLLAIPRNLTDQWGLLLNQIGQVIGAFLGLFFLYQGVRWLFHRYGFIVTIIIAFLGLTSFVVIDGFLGWVVSPMIAIVMVIISFLCFYENWFFHRIQHERFPFWTLFWPFLVINGGSIILYLLNSPANAILLWATGMFIFFNYRHPKIQRWRFWLSVVLFFFMVIPGFVFLLPVIVDGLNHAIVIIPQFSWLGAGIGTSNITYERLADLIRFGIFEIAYHELGVVAMVFLNLWWIPLMVYLLRQARLMSLEIHQLWIKTTAMMGFLMVILFNLKIMFNLPWMDVAHPFLSVSLESSQWLILLALSHGLIEEHSPH